MSNYSFNGVMFCGNVTSLHQEINSMVSKFKTLPTDFSQPCDDSVHMSDIEVFIDSADATLLCLIYKTVNTINMDVLTHLAERHHLEFKGTFTAEDETLDTCGYVIGVRDNNGTLHRSCVTLTECGLTNLPEDPDEQHSFICDAVDMLSDTMFELNKQK